MDVEGLGGVGDVGDDEDLLAVRGAEGDVGEGVEVVGADADGAGRNELGDLRDGVIGDVAANVVAIDGDGAGAAAAAAVVGVGAVVGIGGEVPEEDVLAPVAADADHDAGDGPADAERAIVIALGDGLLGEVDVLVGEGVVDFGHGVDGAAVEMEAGAVDVLGGCGVAEDGEGIERVIEIVIVEDDPGLDAGL